MTTCAAYLRVSSEKQEEDGYGFEAQQADLRAWAARTGHTIPDDLWFKEVVSGVATLNDRPVLLDACRAAWRVGGLVCARVDRWTREPEETAMLHHMFARHGSALLFANGPDVQDKSPTAQLMRGLLELFARYDRLSINLRLSAGRIQARKRGTVTSPPPFGYRVRDQWEKGESNLEVVETEAAAVRYILALGAGKRGPGWIAAQCAAAGYTGRAGRPMQKSLVAKVLTRRPFYEGKTNLFGGDDVNHQPIVRTT